MAKKHRKAESQHNTGTHGVALKAGPGRKSGGQTEGQFEHDSKRNKGQFGQAGDAPIGKK